MTDKNRVNDIKPFFLKLVFFSIYHSFYQDYQAKAVYEFSLLYPKKYGFYRISNYNCILRIYQHTPTST